MLKVCKYKFVLFISFSLLFSACGYLNTETSSPKNDNAESEVAENTETVSDGKTNETAGLCENKYYPVEATKREYKISGSAPAVYVLTQNKTDENSFSETRKFKSGMDMTTNWVCTEEGLRNVEYNSTANLSNANFKMETLESSGLTFPKEWEVGKKWTTEYKISGKLNAGPASGGAKGTVKIDNEITSLNDKVKTPAGEFETAKVVSTINMDLNISRPMKITTTNWYAPDVGLIKQEVKSPFGPQQNVEYTGEKSFKE